MVWIKTVFSLCGRTIQADFRILPILQSIGNISNYPTPTRRHKFYKRSTKFIFVQSYCSSPSSHGPKDDVVGLSCKSNRISNARISEKVQILKDLLRIKTPKAYAILKKYPEFASCNFMCITTNFEDLKARGMTHERILIAPWLLTLGTDFADKKFEVVKETLKVDSFACAAPFLGVHTERLAQIGLLWESERADNPRLQDFRNRISYLATKFKCEDTTVADMMKKAPKLMSSHLHELEDKLRILQEYEVELEDIVKDPYVFMFTSDYIEKRLRDCQTEGLEVVKPWMLRCTPTAFKLYVQRVNQESALRHGHKDIVGFLKEKLNCPEHDVNDILFRVPSVKKASAIKLNEMIDFLYSHGFTAEQIIETPRVLGHSVETIDERIVELASHGLNPQFLNVLCQTSTNYANFIRRCRLLPNNSKTPDV